MIYVFFFFAVLDSVNIRPTRDSMNVCSAARNAMCPYNILLSLYSFLFSWDRFFLCFFFFFSHSKCVQNGRELVLNYSDLTRVYTGEGVFVQRTRIIVCLQTTRLHGVMRYENRVCINKIAFTLIDDVPCTAALRRDGLIGAYHYRGTRATRLTILQQYCVLVDRRSRVNERKWWVLIAYFSGCQHFCITNASWALVFHHRVAWFTRILPRFT